MERDDAPSAEASGWTRGRIAGLTIGIVVAAGILALLVVGLVRPDQQLTIDRRIAENQAPQVPDVTLPVLHAAQGLGPKGAQVALSSLRGKPMVVNLWASWCPPCRSEAPILNRLANRYGPQGVAVVGINVRDLSGDAARFVDEYRLTFPSLRDGSGDTEALFEATGLPETFIVDPDGRMRILPYRGELTRASEAEIAEYLDGVLGS